MAGRNVFFIYQCPLSLLSSLKPNSHKLIIPTIISSAQFFHWRHLPPGEEEKRALDWSAASPFGGYQYDKAQEQPIEKKPKWKGCRERGQPISDPSIMQTTTSQRPVTPGTPDSAHIVIGAAGFVAHERRQHGKT